MATYAELFSLASNDSLRNRIAVAVAVQAATLIAKQGASAAEINWAKEAIADPTGKARALLNYVLAAHKALEVAQITQASDADIQSAVEAAVTAIIAGGSES